MHKIFLGSVERDFPFMAVPLCRPFFAIINDPLRADIAQELNVSGLRLGLALIFSPSHSTLLATTLTLCQAPPFGSPPRSGYGTLGLLRRDPLQGLAACLAHARAAVVVSRGTPSLVASRAGLAAPPRATRGAGSHFLNGGHVPRRERDTTWPDLRRDHRLRRLPGEESYIPDVIARGAGNSPQ